MAAQIRTGVVPLLLAIQQQLVNWPGLAGQITSDQIHFVARNASSIPHFVAEQDILLRPGRFLSKESWAAGGGRTSTLITRVLEVFVRARVALDEKDRDTVFLTDEGAANPTGPVLGLFFIEEAVL